MYITCLSGNKLRQQTHHSFSTVFASLTEGCNIRISKKESKFSWVGESIESMKLTSLFLLLTFPTTQPMF